MDLHLSRKYAVTLRLCLDEATNQNFSIRKLKQLCLNNFVCMVHVL